MARYKYLYERPGADLSSTERLMDFESVLSETLKKKRFHLIRNTVLLTTFISSIIFSIYYFSNPGRNIRFNEERSIPPDMTDTIFPIQKTEPDPVQKPDFDIDIKFIQKNDSQQKKESLSAGNKTENQSPEKADDDPYRLNENFTHKYVYKEAEPVIGFDSLHAYFNRNLNYPEVLLNQKIEGKVVIDFVITREGKVGDVSVVQSLHPVLDSIAVTCVRQMPDWIPATRNGQAINSKHSIPLTFNIVSQ